MTTYNYLLDIDSTDVNTITQVITAGSYKFSFVFTWDTVNQEQYDILARGLEDRAKADPLLTTDGEIIRDYDWIDWYLSLPVDIEQALIDGLEYPQSLKDTQLSVKANIMNERKQEAKELATVRRVYEEQLVWNVAIQELSSSDIFTGVVRPGGWINNQSEDWRVRFVTALEDVAKDQLNRVYIEFEVKE